MCHGSKPVLKYAQADSEDHCWRVIIGFGILGGIQRKKLVSILEYASGPFGATCNTFFVSGSVDAQRMGRPFESIQFQLCEELIIRQAMLENQNFHKCTGQIFVCLIPICWCFWRRVEVHTRPTYISQKIIFFCSFFEVVITEILMIRMN